MRALNDESAGSAEHAAWHAWLQADEQHRWAWQQVERVQQRLQQMPTRLAGRTLNWPASNRRWAVAVCSKGWCWRREPVLWGGAVTSRRARAPGSLIITPAPANA
nr:DUF4880 domain-containing protein [Pseudomonas sp. BIGb0427]